MYYRKPSDPRYARRSRQYTPANDWLNSEVHIAPRHHVPVERAEAAPQPPAQEAEAMDWQAKALSLQAEFDNFRKRQVRRADDAIAAERERLLQRILPVADNLARALAHEGESSEAALREGVALTQRELLRVLEAEGITPVETVGHPLNPHWHDAIATIPAAAESGTIVQEVEPGYKIGDKLLRPARVVVAA